MKSNDVYCIVCGNYYGRYGWHKHVAKEKKLYGNDIYIIKRKRLRNPNAPVLRDLPDVTSLEEYLK